MQVWRFAGLHCAAWCRGFDAQQNTTIIPDKLKELASRWALTGYMWRSRPLLTMLVKFGLCFMHVSTSLRGPLRCVGFLTLCHKLWESLCRKTPWLVTITHILRCQWWTEAGKIEHFKILSRKKKRVGYVYTYVRQVSIDYLCLSGKRRLISLTKLK